MRGTEGSHVIQCINDASRRLTDATKSHDQDCDQSQWILAFFSFSKAGIFLSWYSFSTSLS